MSNNDITNNVNLVCPSNHYATTFFDDAKVIADASRGLGEAMVGINVADLPAPHRLAERGW